MRMKTRLSLTVDPKVTHRAKRYARARNKSLSALVEELLEAVANENAADDVAEKTSFSTRWSNELRPAEKSDIRYERLAQKYDL